MTRFTYKATSRDGKRTNYINTTKFTKQQNTAIRKELAKDKLILTSIEKRTYTGDGVKIETIEI